MAINPATQYPGKIDTSDPDGYPYGKAQNVAVSGDGTGTPWEKALINDLFGLGQALLGEAGITPTGTPDKVGASQYLDAILSLKRKNYITNPSMAVSQENGDGPTTLLANETGFGADEWRTINSPLTGCELEVSRDSLAGLKSYKAEVVQSATSLAGTSSVRGADQRLEAQNVFSLNGKSVILSFVARTNWTGNLAVTILNHDASRSYVVDVPVVSGENVAHVPLAFEAATIATPDNGVGVFLQIGNCNEGDFQTPTGDQWVSGLKICTTNSTQWVETAGNYVEITAVKLEEGTVPSAFEPNSYATDLAQCQRYFQVTQSTSGGEATAATDDFDSSCNFQAQMRSVPVASSVGTITNVNTTSSALNDVTVRGARYSVTSTAAGRAVRTETFYLNARL